MSTVTPSTHGGWHALALVIAATLVAAPAPAQTVDHSKMHHPPPVAQPAAPKPKPKPKPKQTAPAAPTAKPTDPHAGHVLPKHTPRPKAAVKPRPVETPKPVGPHAGHIMPPPRPVKTSTVEIVDHSTMDHGQSAAPDQPRTPIPVLTAKDRLAAFPEVAGHAAHDRSRHSFWLADRIEANDDDAVGWKATAWVGGDIHRLWLRSEGQSTDGRLEHGDFEVLGGRAISPWWDLVAGIRHDFGEGPSQTFVAVGVTGLAPYKIEVEATAYLGSSGQAATRLEASYDTLLTNRLILQWSAEADLYGKDDEQRGVGAGLSTLEAGLRLRFEITRQFAPYIGVSWERAFGGTAGFRRDHFEDVSDVRLLAGIRVWF